MKNLVRVFSVAALLVAPLSLRAQESGIPIGSKPPSAIVQDFNGRSVDLAQLVGKGPAVVEFWATWCENCEALLPTIQQTYRTYGSRVKFIGVSVNVNQSQKRVQLHVAKHKVPGVQVYDTKGDATGKWDVPATSYVVVIGKSGKVVYTGVGGDQKLDAVIRKAL